MRYEALVIGLGKIGLMYDFDEQRVKPSSHCLAYTMNDQIRLIAAADVDVSKKAFLHEVSPNSLFYQDYSEMLDKHCDVDIVSLCTPPANRLEQIRQVIEKTNARIVFCEKPVAQSIEEANEILQLVKGKKIVLVPNISRRWIREFRNVRRCIAEQRLGLLHKVHAKYTRGIYNSGAHLFDMIRMLCSNIVAVQAVMQVSTSADKDDDPSYSFLFSLHEGQLGYAEAFDDHHYYFYEMELYFDRGKIEIKQGGNHIIYYDTKTHSLFTGYSELNLQYEVKDIFHESELGLAVDNLIQYLEQKEELFCTFEDACIPLYVADALKKSFIKQSWQAVEVETNA